MKLLFASDIHGSLSATDKVLARFDESGADYLVILGDILNHGPRNALPDSYNPAQVALRLNQYKDKIIAVQGNCDSEVDQMLLAFPIMAKYQQVLLEQGTRIFLTHGHHYNPEQLPPMSKNDLLVYGHTHLPVAEKQGDIYCFNPGSISIPKGGNVASYGVLEGNHLSVVALESGDIIAQTDLN